MKNQYRFKLDLQMFAEGDEAGGGDVNTEVLETSDSESVEGSSQEQKAPEQDVSQSKAFAKRLKESVAKERAAWEKETSEKYKDYDHYKKAADFMMKENELSDVLTLKEKIELRELNQRAELHGRDVEEQKRIDQLEEKAAKADAYEKQQETESQTRKQQEEAAAWEKTYFDGIADFSKASEGVDVDKLHEFIVENEMNINPNNIQKSFALAHKAMQADVLAAQLADAQKDGMRKVFNAKSSIPNIGGSRGQGQAIPTPPSTMQGAKEAAARRLASL